MAAYSPTSKGAQRPLPAEVCTLAERALAAFGYKAASFQNEEAGVSGELAVLMVRLHEQTNDPELRERVLNTIDEMIRSGFYGIDEQLRRQYDAEQQRPHKNLLHCSNRSLVHCGALPGSRSRPTYLPLEVCLRHKRLSEMPVVAVARANGSLTAR